METNEEKSRNNWREVYADKEELQTRLMKHLMSHVEMALSEANGQAFAYEMDGIKIWFNDKIADALLKMSYEKIKIIEIITQKLMESLGDITSDYAAFLNSPLTDHNLSTRVKHALKANNCGIMLDIAKLGRKGVSRIRNLGQSSIKEIRSVFVRHGCVELFDDPMPTNTRQ